MNSSSLTIRCAIISPSSLHSEHSVMSLLLSALWIPTLWVKGGVLHKWIRANRKCRLLPLRDGDFHHARSIARAHLVRCCPEFTCGRSRDLKGDPARYIRHQQADPVIGQKVSHAAKEAVAGIIGKPKRLAIHHCDECRLSAA